MSSAPSPAAVTLDTTARILAVAGWRSGVFDTGIVETAVLRGWLAPRPHDPPGAPAMDPDRLLAACMTLLRREGLRIEVGAPRRLTDSECAALGVPVRSVSTRHQIDKRYQDELLESGYVAAWRRMREPSAAPPTAAEAAVLGAVAVRATPFCHVAEHGVAPPSGRVVEPPPLLDELLDADERLAIERAVHAGVVNKARALRNEEELPYEDAYVAHVERSDPSLRVGAPDYVALVAGGITAHQRALTYLGLNAPPPPQP